MAGEYVFSLQNLTKQYNKVNILGRHHARLLLRREDRPSSAPTDQASPHCSGYSGVGHGFHWARPSSRGMSGSGFLPQEPRLNPEKDVAGNVEEACAGASHSGALRRGV